jgi:hypothetical protein
LRSEITVPINCGQKYGEQWPHFPNEVKFSEKHDNVSASYSKQMAVKRVRFKARSHLFEIIFEIKTAQISGFQMKKQQV